MMLHYGSYENITGLDSDAMQAQDAERASDRHSEPRIIAPARVRITRSGRQRSVPLINSVLKRNLTTALLRIQDTRRRSVGPRSRTMVNLQLDDLCLDL